MIFSRLSGALEGDVHPVVACSAHEKDEFISERSMAMHKLIDALLHLDRRPNIVLRFADRYLGIPLVVLLGLLSRKNAEIPKVVRSIGILGNAAIGDTVISSAPIADMRAELPGVKLVLFAPGVDCATICSMISGLDAVVPISMNHPVDTIRTIRRHGPFDIWFDFGPWPRTNAAVSFFVPASLRVGFKTPGQYRHAVYDRTAAHGNDVHEVMNYRRLLAAAGISGSHIPALRPQRTTASVPRIVMHVTAGGTAAAMKKWPEPHWISLIDHVIAGGMPVVLTGSGRGRSIWITSGTVVMIHRKSKMLQGCYLWSRPPSCLLRRPRSFLLTPASCISPLR